jgi:acetyltransferase-like isoleucine patch superfamily enzyme
LNTLLNQSGGFKFIGRNVKIYPMAKIVGAENISLDDEALIDDMCFLYGVGRGIELGKFSHICIGTIMLGGGLIKVGDFAAIAPGGRVLSSTDSYDGNGFVGHPAFDKKYRDTKFLDVIIGRHCHIGMGSIIMPGVTLGDGCSIGAGSLVTKDMPEWTICYGTPCKPRRDKPREKQLRMEKEFICEYNERNNL